jgi:aminoglycoside phosphotransferase (APT) family kinase protein
MDEKREQPAIIRHYRGLTKTIVDRHFGKPASRIVYKAAGRTNYVFAVNHIDGQFVVRISPEAEKIRNFQKELWTSQKVREVGVPSPEVIAVGDDLGHEPYMITRRVTGTEATHHPKRDRILHDLGRYAAQINSIRTSGFGTEFDWTRQETNATWEAYLEKEFELDKRLQLFSSNRILSDAKINQLAEIIRGVQTKHFTPSLNHSDLRLKNAIVDEGGDIAAIIDWEDCLSTIAPQWELSVALHDLSIDEKHAFIEGYGLSSGDIHEMAPLIKAFNILNYSAVVETAVEKGDHKQLGELKLRLNGCFDLYSL